MGAGIIVYLYNFQKSPEISLVQKSPPAIIINSHKFNIEISNTEEKRELGLSYRQSIPQDSGMLFVFNSPGQYEFWMNGMLFPLDFVWINNNTIVDLTKNVDAPINGAPVRIIKPKSDVDKVLEINSGQIESNRIEIGQKVQLTGN